MAIIRQQTSILLWISSSQIQLVPSLQMKSFDLSSLRYVALQCRTSHFRSWVSVFKGDLTCKEVAFMQYFFRHSCFTHHLMSTRSNCSSFWMSWFLLDWYSNNSKFPRFIWQRMKKYSSMQDNLPFYFKSSARRQALRKREKMADLSFFGFDWCR